MGMKPIIFLSILIFMVIRILICYRIDMKAIDKIYFYNIKLINDFRFREILSYNSIIKNPIATLFSIHKWTLNQFYPELKEL